jgi:PAS domain S-box-containing protein
MTTNITKKKLFAIATTMFLVTMSSVFLVIGNGNMESGHNEMQTFILNDFNEFKEYTETDLRDYFHIAGEDFSIINNQREFIYIAPKLEDLHGYNLRDNKKMNSLSLIHPKDLTEFANILLKYNKNPHPIEGAGPLRIKTKEGNYITYIIDLIPIFTDKEEKIGSVVILKNISVPLGDVLNDNLSEITNQE